MWKIFLGSLLIVSLAACGFTENTPSPAEKPLKHTEIAKSWRGRQIDELIKYWGQPSYIGHTNSNQEIIEKIYPGAGIKSIRDYNFVAEGGPVSEEDCRLVDVVYALTPGGNPLDKFTCPTRERQLSCKISFRVDDKGKILTEFFFYDDCQKLIRDTTWRAAP